jgi:hypothetical protein
VVGVYQGRAVIKTRGKVRWRAGGKKAQRAVVNDSNESVGRGHRREVASEVVKREEKKGEGRRPFCGQTGTPGQQPARAPPNGASLAKTICALCGNF